MIGRQARSTTIIYLKFARRSRTLRATKVMLLYCVMTCEWVWPGEIERGNLDVDECIFDFYDLSTLARGFRFAFRDFGERTTELRSCC